MDYYTIICKNIVKYRELLGLSQRELSKKCGFSPGYIGLIESLEKLPSNMETLCTIASALNVKVDKLFDGCLRCFEYNIDDADTVNDIIMIVNTLDIDTKKRIAKVISLYTKSHV